MLFVFVLYKMILKLERIMYKFIKVLVVIGLVVVML